MFTQGFLAKDLQAEALGKLDHRVKVAAEQFMKILEQIDSLVRPAAPQGFRPAHSGGEYDVM